MTFPRLPRIAVIGDPQCAPGQPLDHMEWAGKYIGPKRPDAIVNLGDMWDFPSLSSYDKRGSKAVEGRRYSEDIEAGNEGQRLLDKGLAEEVDKSRRAKRGIWDPLRYLLRGNHEKRLERALDEDPRLIGAISEDDMESPGWEVIPFLEVLDLWGVKFSHYFYNPMSGRPFGGDNMQLRIKTVGNSFVQGHQQGLWTGRLDLPGGGSRRGVVAGAFYAHLESYKGPQANNHWRGILMLNEVRNGNFDIVEVSLDYLARRYTGKSAYQFFTDKYPHQNFDHLYEED